MSQSIRHFLVTGTQVLAEIFHSGPAEEPVAVADLTGLKDNHVEHRQGAQAFLRKALRRVLLVPSLAGAVGNLLEWYDFGLYGLFAAIFAQLFFPGQDRIASLIAAYSGFAIGFAARPLAAVLLGHLGDRAGRRAVLVHWIVLMGFATTATAILPTYHAIGIGAPMLLLFMRLLQGLSVGDEFTGSVAYLVETAPDKRRGLAGSIANIGVGIQVSVVRDFGTGGGSI